MKKVTAIAVSIVMVLTMVVAFTGCGKDRTTTFENSQVELVSNLTEEKRDIAGVVVPAVEVWVDHSTSAMAEADALEAKAKELAQKYGADGVYGFCGGTEGIASSDGWTNLVKPIAQADHNTELFIVTDGEMDAPGNEDFLWVGAWNRIKVHFVCLEKNEDTENLKDSILGHKDSFQRSSVTIEYFDGTEEVLIDDFIETQCVIEIVDKDTKYELVTSETSDSDPEPKPEKEKTRKGFPWWLLPLILLGLALGLFLWWLLSRRKEEKKPEDPSPTTPATPTKPTKPTTQTTTQSTRYCGGCRCQCWCPLRGPAIAIAIAACIIAAAAIATVVILAVALL